jgi:hypothetical protein
MAFASFFGSISVCFEGRLRRKGRCDDNCRPSIEFYSRLDERPPPRQDVLVGSQPKRAAPQQGFACMKRQTSTASSTN